MKLSQVGFVGLGVMGGSMAKNLRRAGFELSVFNRNPQRTNEVAALGAVVASSPAEVALRSQAVCLSLTGEDAVRELLFGTDGISAGARPGTLVIDFSTISPQASREFSQQLGAQGISFLDSPVSGGDIGAREGTLTIMVGGPEAEFERAATLFAALGKRVVHMGPSGAGQLTKCVNQILVAGSVAAMTEGMFFAKHVGLDLQKMLDVVSSGAAGSWSLNNYAPRVLRQELGPGFYAKDMLKDLGIALEQAEAIDVSLPVAQLIKELFAKFCKQGGSSLGNHALIKLYEGAATRD